LSGPAVGLEDNGCARRYNRHEQFNVRSSAVVLPFANRPLAFEWPVRSPQFGDEGGIRPTTLRGRSTAASGQVRFARGDDGPDRFRYRDRTMGLLASVDPHDLAGHERVNTVVQKDGEFENKA
jgi:hypothetical protein